ncbi:MAG TPA: DUF5665 domain-containing protein [Candidatus Saccharibacteria bacterium]|nr:DUF5665 domain-containing protein [Candidatus Saccharibacteria bacterium]
MTDNKKQRFSLFQKFKRDQHAGAKRALLESLLNDMYENRRQIYWMNFVRGLFFGLGSVLGGTILIGLLVWLLAQLGAVVPFLSDFIQQILDTLGNRAT